MPELLLPAEGEAAGRRVQAVGSYDYVERARRRVLEGYLHP